MRTCRDVVAKKRAKVSWLRGVVSVMSQCGKFEINALADRELMEMLKDGVYEPAISYM